MLSDAVVLAEACAGSKHVHGGRCHLARGYDVCDAPENGSSLGVLEGFFRKRYLRILEFQIFKIRVRKIYLKEAGKVVHAIPPHICALIRFWTTILGRILKMG